MEYSPSGPERTEREQERSRDTSKMSMLAMAPAPHLPFKRDFPWDDERPPAFGSSRPRSEPERIALPSIRQAIPEFQLHILPQEGSARTPSSAASPTAGIAGTMTPPEYVHSPNSGKRRRLSIEEERELERGGLIPRLYEGSSRSSERQANRGASPPRSAAESWGSSSRTSPFEPSRGLPSMQSPTPIEPVERQSLRPTLPSFRLERPAIPPMRTHSGDDYVQESSRPVVMHHNERMIDSRADPYRQDSYPYHYSHPSRVQSLSAGAIHSYNRSPFSADGYSQYHPEYMRIGELGGMGMGGDSKQRKRRGNLPKETTDKLRAWFVAHLHHPYPTEDEKQELMRQTNLQMNQISNWFINARRRQLPTMINNARAESDAMSGRGADGKALPTTERLDYDLEGKGATPLSDGGDSAFDEDLERRRSSMKRGSV